MDPLPAADGSSVARNVPYWPTFRHNSELTGSSLSYRRYGEQKEAPHA